MRENPYRRNDYWYFYDETGDEHGPFRSHRKAEDVEYDITKPIKIIIEVPIDEHS